MNYNSNSLTSLLPPGGLWEICQHFGFHLLTLTKWYRRQEVHPRQPVWYVPVLGDTHLNFPATKLVCAEGKGGQECGGTSAEGWPPWEAKVSDYFSTMVVRVISFFSAMAAILLVGSREKFHCLFNGIRKDKHQRIDVWRRAYRTSMNNIMFTIRRRIHTKVVIYTKKFSFVENWSYGCRKWWRKKKNNLLTTR